MKNIKHILSIILIATLSFTFTSCKNINVDDETASLITDDSANNSDNTKEELENTDDKNNNVQNKDDIKIELPGNITQTEQENNNHTQSDNTKPEDSNETNSQQPEEKPITNNNNANNTEDEQNKENNNETNDPYKPEPEFLKYQSNTSVPTGNHYLLVSKEETTNTFRGIFPVEEYGRLEYCFYFSNNVDSTWANGDESYRDMPTESYKIISAAIMTTKTQSATTVTKRTNITFDKKTSRVVEAGEMFWSDPVNFTVNEGEYLVFEWTVQYTKIPSNRINGTGIGYDSKAGTTYTKATNGFPMPDMIGAARNKKINIAFMGDSITAGEQAGVFNGYVSQISNKLGKDYSVWNLGLGYARANDAVNSPSWLKKAKTASTVAICFGVNDINSGAYEVGKRTADEIVSDISYIAKEVSDAGAHVIIFSTPPYTYSNDDKIEKWQNVIAKLKRLAEDNNYSYFDFASCLGTLGDPSKPAYGGHPSGDGCKVVADTFIKAYESGSILIK